MVPALRFGPTRPVPATEPFDGETLFRFLRRFAVPATEVHDTVDGRPRLTRAVALAHGPALVRLVWTGLGLELAFAGDPADEVDATARVVALCDADTDTAAIARHLGSDPHLRDLVATSPGLRVPGTTDPYEAAVGALVSQQISMAAAAVCADKIVRRYGSELEGPEDAPRWLFPRASTLAAVDPTELPMPRARGRALVALAAALASGDLMLDPDRPWSQTRTELLAQPGIGPWTADVIGLRGLRRRDILLDTDLVIRRELLARGVAHPARWSPYRSYATVHLWRAYV